MKKHQTLNAIRTYRQRGEVNLLGLGLALLIVGLLSIYLYGEYNESNAETKVQSEVSNWTKIFSKAGNVYSSALDYSGATTQTAINNGIFPSSMVNGTSVRNRFQGAVNVQPVTLVDSNDGLEFSSAKYDADGCRGVANKVSTNVRKLAINGTIVKADGGSLNIDTLGTACTAGGANNTLAMTIGK